jgi:DNA replication ATP-dependent helicase Dna2
MDKNQTLADYYFKKILSINEENTSHEEKFNLYNRLFEQILNALTFDLDIHFSSQFSKMAFVFQEKQPGTALRRQIHQFWKKKNSMSPKSEKDIFNQIQVLSLAISHFFEEPLTAAILEAYPHVMEVAEEWAQEPEIENLDFQRVVVKHFNPSENAFYAMTTEEGKMVKVDCNEAEIMGYYPDQTKFILSKLKAPYFLQLINIKLEQEDILHPQAFVIQPDYLFDVTAIAECFKPEENSHYFHLLKKLTPFQSSIYLVLGNTANFLLDELMANPQLDYNTAMRELFQQNPLPFCNLSEEDSKKLFRESKNHFIRLRNIVKESFPKNGINRTEAQLEPTFYSEKYGLQGRLDVLHRNEEAASIVELKSGTPFRPNKYQISVNHYTQTLLYDLLIRSTFGEETDPKNYVLYSKEADRNLRFAPALPSIQFEALQMRNLLYGIEKLLADSPAEHILESTASKLIRKIRPSNFQKFRKGFTAEDIRNFEEKFLRSTILEQKYFIAFCGFIARENLRAKMGVAESEKNRGQARLWTLDSKEKNQNFMLLNGLELQAIDNSGKNTSITFKRTIDTNPLANFRKGDIIILYPTGSAPTKQQLFKASLLHIDAHHIEISLRNKQHNIQIFESTKQWNAEHDHIDSGFNQMYGALSTLLSAEPNKKQLLLGSRAPQQKASPEIALNYPLTQEQKSILTKMLSKQEYFLLWGPPGTGKTSRMLRYFVQYILEESSENILLLSYTNRAVDEISSAVFEIGEHTTDLMMRIGSRTAASAEFEKIFLSEKVKGLATRKEVKEKIRTQRVVVATVSSILGNQEIFDILDFERVLIDEASQIPEPMLIGLLSKLKNPILIGDHKQLPAVVVQSEKDSKVIDNELHQIGLHDMRNSYFERMYKLAVLKDWSHVIGQLSYQGRMHETIMKFPAKMYYEGQLSILSKEADPEQRQKKDLQWNTDELSGSFDKMLSSERLCFIPSSINEREPWAKLNQDEAEKTADTIESFIQLYEKNNLAFGEESIGVITPFRAQIAQIRQCLHERGLPLDKITIDTVERYQGGARDIIILSTCVNNPEQVDSICSVSDEGIDRKLNVAITRARQQFILIGNEELLLSSQSYEALIGYIRSLTNSQAMEY